MTMHLDHEELHRLLAKLAESDIQEFLLEGEDFRLEVKRNLIGSSPGPFVGESSSNNQAPQPPQFIVEPSNLAPSDPPPAVASSRSEYVEITAPMVGTFYRAAAPGEEPFVEVGNNVKVGQTICILEAMKLMNEIESEFNAEIVEILVENGTPVEFGQVLMRVKQS